MHLRIADTFTDSLARLTGDEQKAVKTTAFDLQLNPAQPGLKLHKLDKPKDPNFWSVRVSSDVRLIVHKSDESLLLCYVDHHDKAYQWAERRRLETHPKTGAAQLVEVRDTVQEVVIPHYVQADVPLPPKPRLLFAEVPTIPTAHSRPRSKSRSTKKHAEQRHLAPLRQAKVRADCGEGDQPPGGMR